MAETHYGCPECGSLLPQVDELVSTRDQTILDQANRISQLQGQIRKLRNQQHGSPEMDPHLADATEVFEYWRERIQPRARELSGERLVKVMARLRAGHTVATLKRAVDGCYLSDWHMRRGQYADRDGSPQNDLKQICADEEKLLRHIAKAEAAEREQPAPAAIIPMERLGVLQARLDRPEVLSRLHELKGWTREAAVAMGLGLDGDRIVFPVRDHAGNLVGLARYQPNPQRRRGTSKMLAEGPRELFPAPETLDTTTCWLVEGEPDQVSLRTAGLPGVGVPGVNTWKDGWAARFERFDKVYVCFDCDEEGRSARDARVGQLGAHTHAIPVDLDPSREDKYDVGDLLMEMGEATASHLASLTVGRSASVQPLRPGEVREDPFELACTRLEERDCRVRLTGDGKATACCPVHEDRTPSLVVTRGDDGRALLHCHAGCEFDDIIAVLDLTRQQLRAA